MKQQAFTLPEQSPVRAAKLELIKLKLDELPDDKRIEVVFRNAHISKTMEQLGGYFGGWVTYLVEQTGYTEQEIKAILKAKCLASIYIAEPVGPLQSQWVELLFIYRENQDQKYHEHASRISLSWAKLTQMKQFMENVKRYCISIDFPLPELERKNG